MTWANCWFGSLSLRIVQVYNFYGIEVWKMLGLKMDHDIILWMLLHLNWDHVMQKQNLRRSPGQYSNSSCFSSKAWKISFNMAFLTIISSNITVAWSIWNLVVWRCSRAGIDSIQPIDESNLELPSAETTKGCEWEVMIEARDGLVKMNI